MRRVITQARDRLTSKNDTSSSHQRSSFAHVPEPSVLAHALVHHLLVDASSARVALARTHGKLLVPELAPHADHLDSLAGVGLDEEAVFHGKRSSRNSRRIFSLVSFGVNPGMEARERRRDGSCAQQLLPVYAQGCQAIEQVPLVFFRQLQIQGLN